MQINGFNPTTAAGSYSAGQVLPANSAPLPLRAQEQAAIPQTARAAERPPANTPRGALAGSDTPEAGAGRGLFLNIIA